MIVTDQSNARESVAERDMGDVSARLKYNGCLDGIESVILACAVAGIDIESNAFEEAVATALDAVGNNS